MNKTVRRLPLAADGEPVDNPPRAMALYKNKDLTISTHRTYHEKDYDDVTRDYNFVGRIEDNVERTKTVSEDRPYAELARDEARRDIKRRRQTYLSNSVKKASSKATFQQQLKATLPKAPVRPINKLSHLTEKMYQGDYIPAEIPVTYKEPDSSSVPKPKKSNCNSLKRSQVYNKGA